MKRVPFGLLLRAGEVLADGHARVAGVFVGVLCAVYGPSSCRATQVAWRQLLRVCLFVFSNKTFVCVTRASNPHASDSGRATTAHSKHQTQGGEIDLPVPPTPLSLSGSLPPLPVATTLARKWFCQLTPPRCCFFCSVLYLFARAQAAAAAAWHQVPVSPQRIPWSIRDREQTFASLERDSIILAPLNRDCGLGVMSAASPPQGYQEDYAHVSCWLLSRLWFRSLMRRGASSCSLLGGVTSPFLYVAAVAAAAIYMLLLFDCAAAAVLNYCCILRMLWGGMTCLEQSTPACPTRSIHVSDGVRLKQLLTWLASALYP